MNSVRLPRKVLFMPTQANIRMINLIREVRPLNEVEFVPIGYSADTIPQISEPRLIDQLKNLNERKAILIWGSGFHHYLSYYFDLTSAGKPIVKINVDQHPDFLDFQTKHWPWGSVPLNCANHMSYSAHRDGFTVHTIVPSNVDVRGGMKVGDKLLIDPVLHSFPITSDSELHLTIDLDAITLFPAQIGWITSNGLSLEKVVGILERAIQTGNLSRLDFGGLIDSIPEFTLTQNITGDVRSSGTVESVGNIHPKNEVSREQNRVLTYAASCFYKILKTAMFD